MKIFKKKSLKAVFFINYNKSNNNNQMELAFNPFLYIKNHLIA
jgi:hypothetical protein